MPKLDENKLRSAYEVYCRIVIEDGEPPVSFEQYKRGVEQSQINKE